MVVFVLFLLNCLTFGCGIQVDGSDSETQRAYPDADYTTVEDVLAGQRHDYERQLSYISGDTDVIAEEQFKYIYDPCNVAWFGKSLINALGVESLLLAESAPYCTGRLNLDESTSGSSTSSGTFLIVISNLDYQEIRTQITEQISESDWIPLEEVSIEFPKLSDNLNSYEPKYILIPYFRNEHDYDPSREVTCSTYYNPVSELYFSIRGAYKMYPPYRYAVEVDELTEMQRFRKRYQYYYILTCEIQNESAASLYFY
jgi:hypothetical protein